MEYPETDKGDEENASDGDELDVAFAAYLRRCDDGELSSREEFLSQFPTLKDELRELMDAADLIDQVAMTGAKSTVDFGSGVDSVVAPVALGADTASVRGDGVGGSGSDPEATLPVANRPKGDSGPTLPFELGDYLLLEVIGRGGMGVVYLAKQKSLQRMVCVKMIRSGILAGESEVRRFYTEAQAAARLRHPGIVAVHQFGRRAGHHFFSMEYIDGTDLQRLIGLSVLDPREAAMYVRDVARAIDHAHQKGVLHRDLKPANVLIDPQNQVHVVDFGLAKNVDADSSITGSGAAVGTPHYMAPEQAGGQSEHATPQCDIYSMGAILFACLTGRPPIVADTVMQTLVQVVHDPAPPLRNFREDAPADLETIAAKCLEKQPFKRYSSAGKLADDLQAFLDGRPINARPRSLIVKAWHWIEAVPVVGAVTGRRRFETTDHHRWLQTVLLLLLLMLPLVIAGVSAVRYTYRHTMPRKLTIAGGLEGGIYTEVARQIKKQLEVSSSMDITILPSGGSLENRNLLSRGVVDLAPLQASAVGGENLCVVAPLFYEPVHLLARNDSGVDSIDDLPGHRIAVGPATSGSRLAAEMVLESMGYGEDVLRRVVLPWSKLELPGAPDIAVVCIGRRSRLVSELLEDGRWKLVPISQTRVNEITFDHQTLRPMTIPAVDYPDFGLPSQGILTVGTTAFLATRLDAPDPLVTEVLRQLYSDSIEIRGLISRQYATEWQGLSFHPAARRFYRSER